MLGRLMGRGTLGMPFVFRESSGVAQGGRAGLPAERPQQLSRLILPQEGDSLPLHTGGFSL